MPLILSILLEESVEIAWCYLERTGELGDPSEARRFLSDVIVSMIRRGTKSRLILSNRAIAACQTRKIDSRKRVPAKAMEP